MIIGITGKSGVGKSTLAKLIAAEHDLVYVDVDAIGHSVLDYPEVKEKIKKQLGVEVSSTNRKALADVVFNNRDKMAELTEITYGMMKCLIYQQIKQAENGVVLDWILLPHTEFFDLCDKKYLIKPVSEEKRKQMVMLRDNITEEALAARDKASITYDESDYDRVILQNYEG